MKRIKLLGLAVLTVLSVVALPSAPTASATELCKAEEDPCSSEKLYKEGTALKASAKNAELTTSLGTITCTTAALEGENTAAAGGPLPALVNKMTFESCKTGAASCTVAAAELPYYALIEKTGKNVASMEMRGDASAGLTTAIKCSGEKEINCTLTDEVMELELKGGKPGQIVASKEPFEKSKGVTCPKESSLTATYSFTAPEQVQVAARPTRLCKSALNNGNECIAGQAFAGGIIGYLPGATVFKVVGTGTPSGSVTCTEAPLTGSFSAIGAGEISALELKSGGGECSSTLGANLSVAASMEHLPATRSSIEFLQIGNPQGLMNFAGTKNLKLKLTPLGQTPCVYSLRSLPTNVTNPGAGPVMTAVTGPWTGVRASGSTMICPPNITVDAKWDIESSGSENIWVAERQA